LSTSSRTAAADAANAADRRPSTRSRQSLDARATKLDRHAHEQLVDAVLTPQERRAGQDLVAIVQHRIDHLADRRRRRAVNTSGLEQGDDFGAPGPRPRDQSVDRSELISSVAATPPTVT
jgi:hypothetical protein